MENPRGHQTGRMGKAKVKMMMIISMYMETTQVWSGSRDLAPKLGSPVATATSLNLPCLNLRCSSHSPHSSFVHLFFLYSQPFSDVFRIEVLYVEETCVSLNNVEVCLVVQCVGKGEEIVGVEEAVAIEVVDDLRYEMLFGACVHCGRGHNNFGYRNRKQSRRVIGMSLVVRYQPYFFWSSNRSWSRASCNCFWVWL